MAIGVYTRTKPVWNKGKTGVQKHSISTRKKMSETRLKIAKRAEQHPSWKHEGPAYTTIHSWLIRTFGKATKCEWCPGLEAKRFDWANISLTYKRDRNDFIQLCPSCHKKWDMRRAKLSAKVK